MHVTHSFQLQNQFFIVLCFLNYFVPLDSLGKFGAKYYPLNFLKIVWFFRTDDWIINILYTFNNKLYSVLSVRQMEWKVNAKILLWKHTSILKIGNDNVSWYNFWHYFPNYYMYKVLVDTFFYIVLFFEKIFPGDFWVFG